MAYKNVVSRARRRLLRDLIAKVKHHKPRMNAPIAPFSQGLLDPPDLNAFGTLLELLVSAGKH
ncbi:MAG TPA: hypothetical protein VGV15_19930, partial [Terriglobales bacterium]|nr:hypothetical protein [Terriglobales bacterium]